MSTVSTDFPIAGTLALAKRLFAACGPASNSATEKEQVLALSDRLSFAHAQPLAAGAADIAHGARRNFVYDKTSRTLFLDCAPGRHRLLMACLECSYTADPTTRSADWARVLVGDNDTLDRLADAFVESGRGLFLSSVWEQLSAGNPKKRKITLSIRFDWDTEEQAAFENYGRDYI